VQRGNRLPVQIINDGILEARGEDGGRTRECRRRPVKRVSDEAPTGHHHEENGQEREPPPANPTHNARLDLTQAVPAFSAKAAHRTVVVAAARTTHPVSSPPPADHYAPSGQSAAEAADEAGKDIAQQDAQAPADVKTSN
jgi:hypothetical protein